MHLQKQTVVESVEQSPREAMQCFLQIAGSALAASDERFASRTLALSRAADAADALGILDADEALLSCHISRGFTDSIMQSASLVLQHATMVP
jgi:hypothetical protein